MCTLQELLEALQLSHELPAILTDSWQRRIRRERAGKLEQDLAELEAEGAKADVRRKVKEAGEREMRQIRDKAQREIDRLDEVLDTFRKLDAKQLVTDELLHRELRDRFGEYFEGGMGAEALQKLLEGFDLTAGTNDSAIRTRRPCRRRELFAEGVRLNRAYRQGHWLSSFARRNQ